MHFSKENNLRDLLLLIEPDTDVRGNSLDSVEGVEVLVEGDLEDGRATLSGSDGRRGEEVRPDSEPSLGEVNGTEDNNGTEERKGKGGGEGPRERSSAHHHSL